MCSIVMHRQETISGESRNLGEQGQSLDKRKKKKIPNTARGYRRARRVLAPSLETMLFDRLRKKMHVARQCLQMPIAVQVKHSIHWNIVRDERSMYLGGLIMFIAFVRLGSGLLVFGNLEGVSKHRH